MHSIIAFKYLTHSNNDLHFLKLPQVTPQMNNAYHGSIQMSNRLSQRLTYFKTVTDQAIKKLSIA